MQLTIPKSDLNISRELMPQINSYDVPSFIRWLQNEYKATVRKTTVPIKSVKCSQGNFNPEKIKGLMQKKISNEKPAILSSDNYIMDGHHRFAAELNRNPNAKFPVFKVSLNIHELLKAARMYKKSYTKELHENINNFEIADTILNEGINDPGIFKAVFLIGAPGSGKDFILKKILAGSALVEINSDHAFEAMMKKHGLSMKMPKSETLARDKIRDSAKNTTDTRESLAIANRLGIVINGTGANPYKLINQKQQLEALGYETAMVFVNVDDKVSQARNLKRERTVPEKIRRDKYNEVQLALKSYEAAFKRFIVIDNSKDIRSEPEDVVKTVTNEWNRVWKFLRAFWGANPKNPAAKDWIQQQMAMRGVTKYSAPHSSRFGSGKQMESIRLSNDYDTLVEQMDGFSQKELRYISENYSGIYARLANNRIKRKK